MSSDSANYIKTGVVACQDADLETGTLVHTACGGVVQYTPSASCVHIDEQVVFFCLPGCKSDFEEDPDHSCVSIYKRSMLSRKSFTGLG